MTTNLKRGIGRHVRDVRKARKLTQEQLAESIGRTPEGVSNIERGISLPNLETLERIADILGEPLSEFFAKKTSSLSVKRAELETKVRHALRDLSDRDAEMALDMIEVIRRSRR